MAERGDEEKAAGTPQRRRGTVGLDAGGGRKMGENKGGKKDDSKHTIQKTGFRGRKKRLRDLKSRLLTKQKNTINDRCP